MKLPTSFSEGQMLWQPDAETVEKANVTRFIRWLRTNYEVDFNGYHELWAWSVDCPKGFWGALWQYFEIDSDTHYEEITKSLEIGPSSEWFIGSRVNWAEHVLRNESGDDVAVFAMSETRAITEVTWSELSSQVRILATRMREMGVEPGDPVCCLMPNILETLVAMLAAISIGAVWSNAAPEFGTQTIVDRFAQMEPKWLFVADGYQYGGKSFDKTRENNEIIEALSGSLERIVLLPYLNAEITKVPAGAVYWDSLMQGADPGREEFQFERVAHDHPLWVLFSSGTTGLPKAIVHSHVGALMGLLVLAYFQSDQKRGDKNFFYTTTGWVMFNILVGMMLARASIVLYDGDPMYPGPEVLWELTEKVGATGFGASPAYISVLRQHGLKPNETFDLSSVRLITCSGSPATPETFQWLYENVGSDIWVSSISGGTELVGAFVGGSPTLPVYAGEIQSRVLGMDVDVWTDESESVTNEVGELVCKTAFPSMPMYFLNDDDRSRYRAAYFDDIPGVWRHGDLTMINERGGVYVYGRSDSTLNRYGVRIGTSEIYRVVEELPEVVDSLVVCLDLSEGRFFMPMFLQLAPECALDDELTKKIAAALRKDCSPRHVPDKLYAVGEIPYTLTGKKLEVPVRRLLMGWPLEKIVSRDSMKNPGSIDFFLNYIATTDDYVVPRPGDA